MREIMVAEIERLREENECLLAMKAGVEIRITDLNASLGGQRDTIRRLRKLVESGKEDRKALDELVDENLRLRGLLKESLVYVLYAEHWTHSVDHLSAKIEKEVSDE